MGLLYMLLAKRVHWPASERAASTLATPVARGDENAGQSAASALVFYSTSQR
jgi:hypothetical protein